MHSGSINTEGTGMRAICMVSTRAVMLVSYIQKDNDQHKHMKSRKFWIVQTLACWIMKGPLMWTSMYSIIWGSRDGYGESLWQMKIGWRKKNAYPCLCQAAIHATRLHLRHNALCRDPYNTCCNDESQWGMPYGMNRGCQRWDKSPSLGDECVPEDNHNNPCGL